MRDKNVAVESEHDAGGNRSKHDGVRRQYPARKGETNTASCVEEPLKSGKPTAKGRKDKELLTMENAAMTLTPIDPVEAKRKHTYQILQETAGLSLADCQFYEDTARRWIVERLTFTAYEMSYAVNSELIRAGKVRLRHAVTGNAVHALVSIYAGAAGYKSEPIDMKSGRVPRLYYPDAAGRRSWLALHLPEAKRDDVEKLAVLMERTAVATEHIAATIAERGAADTAAPASGTATAATLPLAPASAEPSQGRVPKKRGRPPDTDPKEDQRIYEQFKNSGYKRYEDFALKYKHPLQKVKNAIDRHRHRVPSQRKKSVPETPSSPS